MQIVMWISQFLYVVTNWYMYIYNCVGQTEPICGWIRLRGSGVWPLWPQQCVLTLKQWKGNKGWHILQGENYVVAWSKGPLYLLYGVLEINPKKVDKFILLTISSLQFCNFLLKEAGTGDA